MSSQSRKTKIVILGLLIAIILSGIISYTCIGGGDAFSQYVFSVSTNFMSGLVVALVVYLFLENNLKHFFRAKNVLSRPSDAVMELFKEAESEIIIFDTFISDLLSHPEFYHTLNDALQRNIKIKFLLLHPESYATKQRSKDLKANLAPEMKTGLSKLYKFKQSKSEEKKERIEIKLYDFIPSFVLIGNEKKAFHASYVIGKRTQDFHNKLIELNSIDGRTIEQNFKNNWHYDTNIPVEKYMMLKIRTREKALAHINEKANFYFVGSDDLDKLSYFTYKNDGGVDDFFNKQVEKTLNFIQENKDIFITILEPLAHGSFEYKDVLKRINAKYSLNQSESISLLGRSPKIYAYIQNKDVNLITCKSAEIYDEVEREGYKLVSGTFFNAKISFELSKELIKFEEIWDDLPLDEYLKEDGAQLGEVWDFRFRKIAKYNYKFNRNILTFVPDGAFKQPRTYGEQVKRDDRVFESIGKVEADNAFLRMLIKINLQNLLRHQKLSGTEWEITVHFFRVKAEIDKPGFPSPEGIHQDGHDYMAIHLIKKVNANEGVSKIYGTKNERSLKQEYILNDLLDTLYLWDRKVFHYASEVTTDHQAGGYRDVLIIDYDQII